MAKLPTPDEVQGILLEYESAPSDWLDMLAEIYVIRRSLYFSRRRTFDAALRPHIENGVIEYPDAIYYIKQTDLDRAKEAIGYEQ